MTETVYEKLVDALNSRVTVLPALKEQEGFRTAGGAFHPRGGGTGDQDAPESHFGGHSC